MSAHENLSPQQFHELGGRRATVDVSALGALNLHPASRGRIGGGSFSHSGESIELHPDTVVNVRQAKVKKARVQEYVDRLRDGETVDSPTVTDRDGSVQHLDGLHRLVAHRLLGNTVNANVWR